MTDTPQTVLVTGATGYIGGRLVPRLLEQGHRVRCLVRDRSKLDPARWPGVDIVEGNVLDKATLEPAMSGVGAAYYLVHSMAAGEHGFAERDRLAAWNFGEMAKGAGVGRIVYLGGLGSQQGIAISKHLASRQETGEALRGSGVPVTEFRAAVIVGSGSMSFEMIRHLTERLPVMIAPRWVNTRCQPIASRDVLNYLVAALQQPDSTGQVIEIGGGDVLTYGEMLLTYARVRGLRRFILRVPVLTPRLSSLWVDLVTPIPAAFARPLIEGLKTEVVVSNGSAGELFPDIHPITYEQAVRNALNRIGANSVETVWSGSSSSSFDRAPKSVTTETTEGFIIERRERVSAVSAKTIFGVLTRMGGETGWLYANFLWRIRGWLDRLVGGVGMRRGRRHPTELRVGDAVDFWRVEALVPNELVRYGAEMKVPGRAWLEFRIEEAPDSRMRLLMAAIYEPRGLLGVLYWYVLYPVHKVIFSGMMHAIVRQAEQDDRTSK